MYGCQYNSRVLRHCGIWLGPRGYAWHSWWILGAHREGEFSAHGIVRWCHSTLQVLWRLQLGVGHISGIHDLLHGIMFFRPFSALHVPILIIFGPLKYSEISLSNDLISENEIPAIAANYPTFRIRVLPAARSGSHAARIVKSDGSNWQ